MPEGAESPATAQLTPGEKAEVRQDRTLIRKSRESIEDGKRHFADSADRLAESQELLRRIK